jgi:hypothetical protein
MALADVAGVAVEAEQAMAEGASASVALDRRIEVQLLLTVPLLAELSQMLGLNGIPLSRGR